MQRSWKIWLAIIALGGLAVFSAQAFRAGAHDEHAAHIAQEPNVPVTIKAAHETHQDHHDGLLQSLRNRFNALLSALTPAPLPPSGDPHRPAQTFDVVVGPGFTFAPQNLTIQTGDTVRWTWEGGGHNVVSGNTTTCVPDNRFCSPNNANCAAAPISDSGTIYSFTFTQAGVYDYYCSPHCFASMIGRVTVTQFTDGTVQFSAATAQTNEGAGSISLTVTRDGTTTGAATVDYATNDNLAFTECNAATGVANQRCDYIATGGTLSFAANETSKTFVIPIADDLYVEGAETLGVTLSNPSSGTALGTQATATVTVNDNDTTAPTQRLFVAQLSNAQEVPTNNSTATGNGTVLLNDAETQITANMSFTGLSSAQTAAHIHGASHVGVNSVVLFNLGTGTVTNATFSPNATQVNNLKKGLNYFNVHTQNFTGGEIRGQILNNALESARFFVRQNYLDFLNRVPDQSGFDFWTGEIVNTCSTDLACIHQRRIAVSAAFFIEQEFQESGAYVYRLYKAAFGEQTLYRPTYAQFVPDRARVVGGADLNAGKLAFANSFVQRNEFTTRYPASQTPTQFVDAILTTVQQGAGVTFNATERTAFINTVTNSGRGTFLRDLGDNTAFRNAIFNRAFVLVQYFGYLRRDPDDGGYNFWLGVLNMQPNNFNGMVCAFITSSEFQRRFSDTTPRTNADCN